MRWLGVPVLLFACLAGAWARTGGAASDVLLKALTVQRKISVSAIQSRLVCQKTGASMKSKLESDDKGLYRMTVLQPVTQQGIVMVDDGRTIRTYSKDEGAVYVMASPRVGEPDPTKRVALVERNYTLRIELDGKAVAGRDTIMIVASPKRPEMPERRLYIDRRNLFVLRHETIEGDQRLALLDTVSVSYPTKPDPDLADPPPGQWKPESPGGPIDLTDLDAARKRLGFRPLMPRDLPSGFTLADVPIYLDKNGLLGLRITDGLAVATVYQWSPKRAKDPTQKMAPDRIGRDGIAVLIVGAIPEHVRRRLLDAYAPARHIHVEVRAGMRR